MRTILVACLFVFACGKSEPGSTGEGSAKPAGDKAGGSTTIVLDKLGGLKAEVPAGAKAGDALVGDGVMIQGPDLVVTVEAASETRPKTIDEAKKEAEMFNPKNLKDEALADGWALTYDNEGSTGKNFFVQARREIGGKAYWCETTASSAAQQASALKTCRSLKP